MASMRRVDITLRPSSPRCVASSTNELLIRYRVSVRRMAIGSAPTAALPDGRLVAFAGIARRRNRAYFFAMKPAFSISVLCWFSACVTQLTNSCPVMNDWLNAAFSLNSFQSGVARIFLKRSM
jgi:hypothetical protein